MSIVNKNIFENHNQLGKAGFLTLVCNSAQNLYILGKKVPQNFARRIYESFEMFIDIKILYYNRVRIYKKYSLNPLYSLPLLSLQIQKTYLKTKLTLSNIN